MLKKQATKKEAAKKARLLTKKKPEKRLLLTLKRKTGHGSGNRITVRHKGGGVKKRYRIIDFGQTKIDIASKVIALEYDPYRTAFIMLLEYEDGEKRYQIAPSGLENGDKIICAEKAEIKPGNRMKIMNIPEGTMIYNIELEPGRGGKMVRGAGTNAIILDKETKYVNIVMPSKEKRRILGENFASIGQVSFPEHRFINLGKAGVKRRKGIRPTVRGTAMNPCDHPHGGGEGRTGRGMKHPKTPCGKPALGVKTRRRLNTDKYIIQRRRKK